MNFEDAAKLRDALFLLTRNLPANTSASSTSAATDAAAAASSLSSSLSSTSPTAILLKEGKVGAVRTPKATLLAGAGVEEEEESALVAQASLPAEAVPSLPAEPVLSLPAETGGAAWTGETAAR